MKNLNFFKLYDTYDLSLFLRGNAVIFFIFFNILHDDVSSFVGAILRAVI